MKPIFYSIFLSAFIATTSFATSIDTSVAEQYYKQQKEKQHQLTVKEINIQSSSPLEIDTIEQLNEAIKKNKNILTYEATVKTKIDEVKKFNLSQSITGISPVKSTVFAQTQIKLMGQNKTLLLSIDRFVDDTVEQKMSEPISVELLDEKQNLVSQSRITNKDNSFTNQFVIVQVK